MPGDKQQQGEAVEVSPCSDDMSVVCRLECHLQEALEAVAVVGGAVEVFGVAVVVFYAEGEEAVEVVEDVGGGVVAVAVGVAVGACLAVVPVGEVGVGEVGLPFFRELDSDSSGESQ